MRRLPLFLTLACALTWNVQAEMRNWTSRSGETVQAELVDIDEQQNLILKTSSGQHVAINVNDVSKSDQEWIIAQVKEPTATQEVESNQPTNFDKPWPQDAKADTDVEVTTVQEGPDLFIYETPHFRYTCDAKIGPSIIRKLSIVFETAYAANKALPLNNAPTVDPNYKFEAYLFDKIEDYYQAGGKPGTAGIQIWRTGMGKYGRVLCPFASLGVKKSGKTYVSDSKVKDMSVLIHEITHLLMSNAVKKEGWFTEGSAEYVGLSPFNAGRINFRGNKKSIIQSVTAYGAKGKKGGRALGKDINVGSLEKFMDMSYEEFTGSNAMKNYGVAPLLVYYFYTADGKGDAAQIKKYVKALQSGATTDEAKKQLLGDRSWSDLEKSISAFWKRSGINLSFD
jgi:small nuclear ribonucleoprotein (snRNP)-like protein